MHKAHDGVPEHEAQRHRQRRNIDSGLKDIQTTISGPVRTKRGGHEGHAIGGIRDEGKETGETADQPEHDIWPGSQAMYGLLAIAPQSTGEVGANVERAGSAGTHKNHKVFVAQI